MGWVYNFIKKLLSNATVSKVCFCQLSIPKVLLLTAYSCLSQLEMLSSSKELVSWLGEDIPKEYGGKGESLKSGSKSVQSPKDVDGEAKETAATKEQSDKPTVVQEVQSEKVAEAKITEEAPKEAAPLANGTTPTETAAEESKVAETAATTVPETATSETETPKVEEKPAAKEEVTPLPLTEPVTAEVVVAVAATQPIAEVEVREDAPAPKDVSDVPVAAPVALTEAPKTEEKKE